jgi:hypothetical protein
MGFLWVPIAVAVGTFALAVAWVVRWRYRRRATRIQRALAEFRIQREHLEARFFDMAAKRNQPPGWTWVDCEFEDDVVLACKRGTDNLRALVRITLHLERLAAEGHGEPRRQTRVSSATAIFLRSGACWAKTS